MEGEGVKLVPPAFLELIGTLIGADKVPLHWGFTSPVKKITHQNRLAQWVKGQGNSGGYLAGFDMESTRRLLKSS